jgi:hypothetical protein
MNCPCSLAQFTLAFMLLLSSPAALAAQDVTGVWTDAAGEVIYGFKDTHEFLFRGSKQEAQGSWQAAKSICWKGYENTQQPGNLMVYVQSLHCCLVAKRVNGNLVLTKVWEGGYTKSTGMCQDRVLRRLKETTK